MCVRVRACVRACVCGGALGTLSLMTEVCSGRTCISSGSDYSSSTGALAASCVLTPASLTVAGGAMWAFQVILFCVGVLRPAARPLHARLATFSSTPFAQGHNCFLPLFISPSFLVSSPCLILLLPFLFVPPPILITTLMSLPESWPQTRWDQITGKGRCRPPTLAVGVLWGLSSTQAERVGDLFCSCCWEQAVPNPWQECNPWTRMPLPPPCPKHLLFLESHSCGWTFEWEWWVAQLLAFFFFVIHLTHTHSHLSSAQMYEYKTNGDIRIILYLSYIIADFLRSLFKWPEDVN